MVEKLCQKAPAATFFMIKYLKVSNFLSELKKKNEQN